MERAIIFRPPVVLAAPPHVGLQNWRYLRGQVYPVPIRMLIAKSRRGTGDYPGNSEITSGLMPHGTDPGALKQWSLNVLLRRTSVARRKCLLLTRLGSRAVQSDV